MPSVETAANWVQTSYWKCRLESTDAKGVCLCVASGLCCWHRVQTSGFPQCVAAATAKVVGFGFRGHGRGVPSLTCLHTRDTGGVKHPLPLSRTQRDLVCQQVYLTQRPTQRIDKTVEQRQLNVSVQQSKAMHLWLYFTYTCFCFPINKVFVYAIRYTIWENGCSHPV